MNACRQSVPDTPATETRRLQGSFSEQPIADCCAMDGEGKGAIAQMLTHQVREKESRVNRPESLGALPLLHDARDVTLAAPLPRSKIRQRRVLNGGGTQAKSIARGHQV